MAIIRRVAAGEFDLELTDTVSVVESEPTSRHCRPAGPSLGEPGLMQVRFGCIRHVSALSGVVSPETNPTQTRFLVNSDASSVTSSIRVTRSHSEHGPYNCWAPARACMPPCASGDRVV
jgi:hypothetical protein